MGRLPLAALLLAPLLAARAAAGSGGAGAGGLRALLQEAPPPGAALPTPLAFFSLANGSLASRYGPYGGYGDNITWQPSPADAGDVLNCNKSADSTVRLDPVPYGTRGRWALSVWFKPSPAGLAGNQFEYLFSHQKRGEAYTSGWEANQVRLYFPQLGHPAFGVIRAIVKDSTQAITGPPGQTFLDSDGSVGQRIRERSSPALRRGAAALQDSRWHMITLSTLAAGRGYAMFLDGEAVGQLDDATVQQSGYATVDGGGSLDLTDAMYLCGRTAGNETRTYDGQLAGLAIFDASLDSAQVQALYQATRPPGSDRRALPQPLPASLVLAPAPAPAEGPAPEETPAPAEGQAASPLKQLLAPNQPLPRPSVCFPGGRRADDLCN